MKVGDKVIYLLDGTPGYISKITTIKGAGGGDLLLYDLVREIYGKPSDSHLCYGVFDSDIMEINIKKTCGTCRFWNFRVSDENRCWGQCLNEKVHESIYISNNFPDRMKSTEEYHQFVNDVRENCQVYFEEENFGCILHEKR